MTEAAPSLLVSYAHVHRWFWHERSTLAMRDWALDSGAFTAHRAGEKIDLDAYIAFAQEARATDPRLAEVFALDVIGDWRASRQNAEMMWAAGVPAIPCFHYGSPWDELESLARDFPKIALGGVSRLPLSARQEMLRWLHQCFARVWPKQIHGFGMSGRRTLTALPFHSVDASTWSYRPAALGIWQAYREQVRIPSRALHRPESAGILRAEIAWYMDLERDMRARWGRQMAAQGWHAAPTVRLAVGIEDHSMREALRQRGAA